MRGAFIISTRIGTLRTTAIGRGAARHIGMTATRRGKMPTGQPHQRRRIVARRRWRCRWCWRHWRGGRIVTRRSSICGRSPTGTPRPSTRRTPRMPCHCTCPAVIASMQSRLASGSRPIIRATGSTRCRRRRVPTTEAGAAPACTLTRIPHARTIAPVITIRTPATARGGYRCGATGTGPSTRRTPRMPCHRTRPLIITPMQPGLTPRG